MADTGIPVPFKAYAPLTLPGKLSTLGHCDQLRVAKVVAYIPSKGWMTVSYGGNLPTVGVTLGANHDSLRTVEFQEIGTQQCLKFL